MSLNDFRPTRVEINLDNLKNNMREIRRIVDKDKLVTAVIKADAYGHGAVKLAKIFLANGCDRLAVSTVEEGIELRKSGIKAPILLLNNVSDGQLENIIKYELTPSIYSYESAERLNEISFNNKKTTKIHIKIDTGMSRLGFQSEEKSVNEIENISKLKNLEIEGMYSHFSTADEFDKSFTHEQFKKFMWVANKLEERNISIKIKHICNSAGILDFPDYHLDMVRAGIILYGYYPSKFVNINKINLMPALKLKSNISHIKDVKEDTPVGYGRRFVTDTPSVIGTIPIGYADGYTRLFRGKVKVKINGKFYSIIGNICMDQCMVLLDKEDNIKVGDEVELINYEDQEIKVETLAQEIGTISYEVLCMLGRRIPRLYFENNKLVSKVDYLLS